MGCLAGQLVCMATAPAISATTLLAIKKREMVRALHSEHALSDRFTTYLLTRNIRAEENLVDQLFNPSEKPLARAFTARTLRREFQSRAWNSKVVRGGNISIDGLSDFVHLTD
jgi:hypothetical protein